MLKPLPRFGDCVMTVTVWLAVALVIGMFLWMLADLTVHGLAKLNGSFLFDSPESSGRAGGIGPILVSTLLILAVALAAAIPLGLGTAVYLSEYTRSGGPTARLIGMSLDVLASVPSIVFGLFGNAVFCVWLGLGFSILSGGLTLACMMLPIFIRATESGLSAVPTEWRLGAAALGLTRAVALWRVLLPAAAPAMTAGLMLSIGRALAETAALIFTSGYVDRMPGSLFDSGRALAVHIYDLSMNVTGGDASAYGGALVLIVLLLVINATASYLSHRLLGGRTVTS